MSRSNAPVYGLMAEVALGGTLLLWLNHPDAVGRALFGAAVSDAVLIVAMVALAVAMFALELRSVHHRGQDRARINRRSSCGPPFWGLAPDTEFCSPGRRTSVVGRPTWSHIGAVSTVSANAGRVGPSLRALAGGDHVPLVPAEQRAGILGPDRSAIGFTRRWRGRCRGWCRSSAGRRGGTTGCRRSRCGRRSP